MLRTIQVAPRVVWKWLKATGWKAALGWTLYRMRCALGIPPPSLRLHPKQLSHAVGLRLGNSSDVDVFEQIFLEEQYAVLTNIPEPGFILDLGANAGYSSCYFLSCFPSAKVLAVEPDPENARLCQENLASYGNRAMTLVGAAWSRCTTLELVRDAAIGCGREWAIQVRESETPNDAAIQAWDIPALLALARQERIGLLKIDIERSELAIMPGARAWLDRVDNLCIELHGDDCQAVFFDALEGFDYQLEHAGELTICRQLRPK